MFCKNCGKEFSQGETVCNQCNAPMGEGVNFCPNCALEVSPETTQCNRCGAMVNAVHPIPQPQSVCDATSQTQHPKSRLAVGVLALLFGWLGIHNFYIGNKSTATTQLVLGLLGIVTCSVTTIISAVWSFIDAIKIFSGDINYDAYGLPFKS